MADGDELVCHSFEPAGGAVRLGLGMGGKKPQKSRLSTKKINQEEDEDCSPDEESKETTESEEEGEEGEEDEVAVEKDEVEVILPPSKDDRAKRVSKRQAAQPNSNPASKAEKARQTAVTGRSWNTARHVPQCGFFFFFFFFFFFSFCSQHSRKTADNGTAGSRRQRRLTNRSTGRRAPSFCFLFC